MRPIRVPMVRACSGWALALAVLAVLPGCQSLVRNATTGFAADLNQAILDQDDPALVRDGAPTLLLVLDSMVARSPDDPATLAAATQLYAAYGLVFVDDPERARTLTRRARSYGERALCASNEAGCGLDGMHPADVEARLDQLEPGDIEATYAYALGWLAYIQAHRDDTVALARLPQATRALERVRALDAEYRPVDIDHYLGVLDTLRPPALGGDFESGQAHFEQAIERSAGTDLAVKVDYARYYARTLYDRELHDRLLQEVLATDPVQPGRTLFNTLAQREARQLLESADDYF